MIRKETKTDDERVVFFIVKDDINVSVIISELSSMGCKGEELGKAYRKLSSDDKGYSYENKEIKEKLIVIDERNFNLGLGGSPFLCMFWAFALSQMLGNPCKDILENLKKDGEEIK